MIDYTDVHVSSNPGLYEPIQTPSLVFLGFPIPVLKNLTSNICNPLCNYFTNISAL